MGLGFNGTKASDLQIGGDHYKTMKIQPNEFITANQLKWCEGNAIKYICRHSIKGGKQDIEKAIHYLQLLLEIEYSHREYPVNFDATTCTTDLPDFLKHLPDKPF